MMRTILLWNLFLLGSKLPSMTFALSFPSSPSSPFSSSSSSSNYNNHDSFALSDYQKARALETAQSLDASRLHFQIMFVDDDNIKGRIAEGLLARVAEYNDAMFILFPTSSTIDASRNAPRDAAAPERAVAVCESLGLCETTSTMDGTSFDLSYLDEYDLLITMDDDIRSLILRSLSAADQEYYAPKVRLLSEFLSPEFCSINGKQGTSPARNEQDDILSQDKTIPKTTQGITSDGRLLLDMLDQELRDRVAPCSDLVIGRSTNVLMSQQFDNQVAAALIIASSGITKFCLETMQAQFDSAFESLLIVNFHNVEHLMVSGEQADAQLRRCSHSVTGFFSREQRLSRFERHIADLRIKLVGDDSP